MKKEIKQNAKQNLEKLDLKQWIADGLNQKHTEMDPKERHINSGGWIPQKNGAINRLI